MIEQPFYSKTEKDKLSKLGKSYYETDLGHVKMIKGSCNKLTEVKSAIEIIEHLKAHFGKKLNVSINK
jgi:hypothetical protein